MTRDAAFSAPPISIMPEQEGAIWIIVRKVGRIEYRREVHERFLPPELVEQLKRVVNP